MRSPPPLAEHHAPGCRVRVEALLEAYVSAGSPWSPLSSPRLDLDPGHGAGYLSCTWLVRVNGTAYRYRRSSHWGPYDPDLSPETCREPAEARATCDEVVEFATHGCSDLHAGEYYGHVLEPL